MELNPAVDDVGLDARVVTAKGNRGRHLRVGSCVRVTRDETLRRAGRDGCEALAFSPQLDLSGCKEDFKSQRNPTILFPNLWLFVLLSRLYSVHDG